ncbi:hypothetical protein EDB89DRAFT_705732 [Lactarius sanguifluus]|nr:hypothetical protein EDB89DRAFT_705732 [Lactarius sanguifluus]
MLWNCWKRGRPGQRLGWVGIPGHYPRLGEPISSSLFMNGLVRATFEIQYEDARPELARRRPGKRPPIRTGDAPPSLGSLASPRRQHSTTSPIYPRSIYPLFESLKRSSGGGSQRKTGQHHRITSVRGACAFGPCSGSVVARGGLSVYIRRLVGQRSADGYVYASFGREFDAFELGNRYVRGIGGRPMLTRLSASLPASV